MPIQGILCSKRQVNDFDSRRNDVVKNKRRKDRLMNRKEIQKKVENRSILYQLYINLRKFAQTHQCFIITSTQKKENK